MRMLVIILAAAAVGFAAYEKYMDHGPTRMHRDALQLVYAYSSNQEELLRPLIQEFNDAGHEVAGRRVEIVGMKQTFFPAYVIPVRVGLAKLVGPEI